ncbi:MAG: IPT/TIG domain-containing protein [Methanospirillum sp.]
MSPNVLIKDGLSRLPHHALSLRPPITAGFRPPAAAHGGLEMQTMIREFFNRGGRVPPWVLGTVVAISLMAAGAQAVMLPQEQSDLAMSADSIILGTVTSVESHWTADRNIETTAEIALESVVKGTSPGTTVPVTIQGGTVDGVTQVVEDQPVPASGERAFYLLDRASSGFRLHGAGQGVVPVVDDRVWVADGAGAPRAVSATAYGARLAAVAEGREPPVLQSASIPASGGPVVASVSPSSASAGTGTTVTITGTGFGTKASRESAADVGFVYRCTSPATFTPVYATGRPYFNDNANEIVSWTDTRIVVRVPAGRMPDGYWGAASSGGVWVVTDAGASSPTSPFAVSFGYAKLKWASPATFVVSASCPGVTDAAAAVASAAGTWNAALAGSTFRFINGGTTSSTTIGEDRRNLICWKPASDFADPSMVAVTHWWFVGSNLVECDVALNAAFAWTTGTASGSTRSVEAVMLHEFGHWLGLRDLYGYRSGAPTDVGKAMFGQSNSDFGNLNRRTLAEGDIAGARYIYGGGTPTAPGPSSGMVAVPGGTEMPRDLDLNGQYEDVNGNGRRDFADVVLYFSQISWIATHESVALFDFNSNGRIDFADDVSLFERL